MLPWDLLPPSPILTWPLWLLVSPSGSGMNFCTHIPDPTTRPWFYEESNTETCPCWPLCLLGVTMSLSPSPHLSSTIGHGAPTSAHPSVPGSLEYCPGYSSK